VTAKLLAVFLVLATPTVARAEWQLKPFLGVVFAGNTTPLSDLDAAVGEVHAVYGISAVLLGEIFGIEGDVARAPALFIGDKGLVLESNAVTVTGNLVVAMPRRLTQYTLRPYFVGGGGLMHVYSEGSFSLVLAQATLPGVDVGGGATGFLTRSVGLNWDVRRFWSVGGGSETVGISLGPQQLSFWRANMALAIRF